MRAIRGVMAVVLMAAGCGGASTRSRGDEMSDPGAPSGGTTASAGTGTSGAHMAASGSGTVTGGSAPGGAERPTVNLGDGDHADDEAPTIPIDSTGGFFWRGCGSSGWRLGNWFVTSDRQLDALSREIDPPRGASTEARGATGANFAAGAVLWVQLDHPRGRSVSLSGCSALSFWARLESPSGRVVVALNGGSRGTGSLDGRSTLPSRTLDVGPDWQEFTLPFESFPIEGLSTDDLALASIEFFVGDGGESFDLWVDDLALVCSGGC